MGIYQVKEGKHHHRVRTAPKKFHEITIHKGECIETDKDMCALFPNKFTRIDVEGDIEKSFQVYQETALSAESDRRKEEEGKASPPEDVTSEFDSADAFGVRVVLLDSTYRLFEGNSSEPFAEVQTKEKVEKVIEDYFASAE